MKHTDEDRELISMAVIGLDAKIAELQQRREDYLRELSDGGSGKPSGKGKKLPSPVGDNKQKPKRKLSAAGRKSIGDAARKRWKEHAKQKKAAAAKHKAKKTKS